MRILVPIVIAGGVALAIALIADARRPSIRGVPTADLDTAARLLRRCRELFANLYYTSGLPQPGSPLHKAVGELTDELQSRTGQVEAAALNIVETRLTGEMREREIARLSATLDDLEAATNELYGLTVHAASDDAQNQLRMRDKIEALGAALGEVSPDNAHQDDDTAGP